jgi:hypothetical protein
MLSLEETQRERRERARTPGSKRRTGEVRSELRTFSCSYFSRSNFTSPVPAAFSAFTLRFLAARESSAENPQKAEKRLVG